MLEHFIWTTKELSFCHKLWFYNRHIFLTWWCKALIFQTIIIWSKVIHSLKYLRSPTIKCKDIWIRTLEFMTKTQFLWNIFSLTQHSDLSSECFKTKLNPNWTWKFWNGFVTKTVFIVFSREHSITDFGISSSWINVP